MSKKIRGGNILSEEVRKDFLEEMAFRQEVSILLAGEKKDALNKQKRVKCVCIVRNSR